MEWKYSILKTDRLKEQPEYSAQSSIKQFAREQPPAIAKVAPPGRVTFFLSVHCPPASTPGCSWQPHSVAWTAISLNVSRASPGVCKRVCEPLCTGGGQYRYAEVIEMWVLFDRHWGFFTRIFYQDHASSDVVSTKNWDV